MLQTLHVNAGNVVLCFQHKSVRYVLQCGRKFFSLYFAIQAQASPVLRVSCPVPATPTPCTLTLNMWHLSLKTSFVPHPVAPCFRNCSTQQFDLGGFGVMLDDRSIPCANIIAGEESMFNMLLLTTRWEHHIAVALRTAFIPGGTTKSEWYMGPCWILSMVYLSELYRIFPTRVCSHGALLANKLPWLFPIHCSVTHFGSDVFLHHTSVRSMFRRRGNPLRGPAVVDIAVLRDQINLFHPVCVRTSTAGSIFSVVSGSRFLYHTESGPQTSLPSVGCERELSSCFTLSEPQMWSSHLVISAEHRSGRLV